MPEHSTGVWWFALGTVLPREIRERIFEPACYDLLRERASRDKDRRERWSYSLRAVNILLSSSWRGALLVLPKRRGVRKFAKIAVFGGLAAAILMLILLRDWILQLPF